jgi:hypothetical protein
MRGRQTPCGLPSHRKSTLGTSKMGAELAYKPQTTKLACTAGIGFPRSTCSEGGYRGVRGGLARSYRLHA